MNHNTPLPPPPPPGRRPCKTAAFPPPPPPFLLELTRRSPACMPASTLEESWRRKPSTVRSLCYRIAENSIFLQNGPVSITPAASFVPPPRDKKRFVKKQKGGGGRIRERKRRRRQQDVGLRPSRTAPMFLLGRHTTWNLCSFYF